MSKRIDFLNTKFGKLKVLEPMPKVNNKQLHYKCLCDCGKECIIRATQLRNKTTKSCGCYKKEYMSNKKWKGCGELSSSYLASIICRARKINREFNITIEYCWNLFLEQNKRCALSGELLTFARNRKLRTNGQTASLDRIDSSKGYIEGNVQWVHKFINKMKQSISNRDFIDKCKQIVSYNMED